MILNACERKIKVKLCSFVGNLYLCVCRRSRVPLKPSNTIDGFRERLRIWLLLNFSIVLISVGSIAPSLPMNPKNTEQMFTASEILHNPSDSEF